MTIEFAKLVLKLLGYEHIKKVRNCKEKMVNNKI